MKLAGEGSATISVTLYDAKDRAIDWSYGAQSTRATSEWRRLHSRFVVPPQAATMLPRLIGDGPATVWMDDASLLRTGSIENVRGRNLPEKLTASNETIEATFHVADASLTLVDRRNGHAWRQRPSRQVVVLEAKPADHGFRLRLLDLASVLELACTVRLESQGPEMVVELSASGDLPGRVKFPPAWTSSRDSLLILPVNEGISYPAGDSSLEPMSYHLFGGHGLCMAWWGLVEGEQGIMALVETPDDAAVDIPRLDGLLTLAPQWLPQKGQFGPSRKIRYVFFDQGGYVAMCKRYRRYAQTDRPSGNRWPRSGKANPNVDLLVGAVNVWCCDRNAVAICREMQAAGISAHPLEQRRQGPEQTPTDERQMGVLTSRYDIYQDVMDPANFPSLRWTASRIGPRRPGPKDLMLDAHGDWDPRLGESRAKDGRKYPCGVLCDRQALDYARRRGSGRSLTPIPIAAASSTPPPPRRGGSAIRPSIP